MRRSMSFSQGHSGHLGQAYSHPARVSLLPPPEVTRLRCLTASQKKAQGAAQGESNKNSLLRKLRLVRDGREGVEEEPIRKLPLPEIFYNPNRMPEMPDIGSDGMGMSMPMEGSMGLGSGMPMEQMEGQSESDAELEIREMEEDAEEEEQQQNDSTSEEEETGGWHARVQEVREEKQHGHGMVSRRAIISRSRDDLQQQLGGCLPSKQFTGEDQWFSKEKLYKDHIAEVLEKWDNIDDEIWAKVIVLERNRRIAKAYARAPVLTVNGTEDGFDGFRIGVNGFENPMRDSKVTEFKSQIGAGCKLKMDDSGNILVKRVSKGNIYVKNTAEETAVSNDILKLPNGLLDMDKPFKLFDMKKFQQNVNREMKRQFPERNKLETQCISTIAFVKNEGEVLDSPIWIMLINIVALEMLGAKMPKPTGPSRPSESAPFLGSNITSTLKKPMAHSGSSDEDPYSLTPSGSSGSSGKGLRDRSRDDRGLRGHSSDGYGPQHWGEKGAGNDLSDDYVEEDLPRGGAGRSRTRLLKKAEAHRAEERRRANDDPYYCGFSARVPTFNNTTVKKPAATTNKPTARDRAGSRDVPSRTRLLSPHRPSGISQLPGPSSSPFWWQSRLYPDSGIGELSSSPSGGSPALSHTRAVGSQLRNGGVAFRTQELSSFQEGKKSGRNGDFRNQFHTTGRPSLFRQGWE